MDPYDDEPGPHPIDDGHAHHWHDHMADAPWERQTECCRCGLIRLV